MLNRFKMRNMTIETDTSEFIMLPTDEIELVLLEEQLLSNELHQTKKERFKRWLNKLLKKG